MKTYSVIDMSFHGRAPRQIQQAMQAMVPAPRRNMYSAAAAAENPMLSAIQRGYHPTEGPQPKMIRPQQVQTADPWGPAESWNQIRNDQMTDIGPFADRDLRPLRNINRETAPGTSANTPANQDMPGALVQQTPVINVESGPARWGNFSPEQMAGYLIDDKLRAGAIIGGGVVGTGLLGMGINGLQGDPNGNILQNPVTQAALVSGAGAYLGHEGVDMYQQQQPIPKTPLGFDQPASVVRASRQGRNRAYGAIAGTAAGALASLTTQLNDRLQTEQY